MYVYSGLGSTFPRVKRILSKSRDEFILSKLTLRDSLIRQVRRNLLNYFGKSPKKKILSGGNIGGFWLFLKQSDKYTKISSRQIRCLYLLETSSSFSFFFRSRSLPQATMPKWRKLFVRRWWHKVSLSTRISWDVLRRWDAFRQQNVIQGDPDNIIPSNWVLHCVTL